MPKRVPKRLPVLPLYADRFRATKAMLLEVTDRGVTA